MIISVSIPPAVRKALDGEARRQRRSRSFVVSEAVQQYIARQRDGAFTEARDQNLRDNLALTPAARVALAEELWDELAFARKPARAQALSFDTFADYERWQKSRARRA